MLTSFIKNDNNFYDNNQYQRRSIVKYYRRRLLPKINSNKNPKSNSFISNNECNKYFTMLDIQKTKNIIKNNSIEKNRLFEKKLFKNILKKRHINSNSQNNSLNKSSISIFNNSLIRNKILEKPFFPIINKNKTIINENDKNDNYLNQENNKFYKYLYLEYKGENNDKGFNNITYIEINPHKIISSLSQISKNNHSFKKDLYNTLTTKLNSNLKNNDSSKIENITTSNNENNNYLYYYDNIFKINNENIKQNNNTSNNNVTLVYDKFLLPNKNNEYTFSIHNLFLIDIINKVFKKMIELHNKNNKIISEEQILKEYNRQIQKLKLYFEQKTKEKKINNNNKKIINNDNKKNILIKKIIIDENNKNQINNQNDKCIQCDIITNRETFYNIKEKIINNSKKSFKSSLNEIFYQNNDNNDDKNNKTINNKARQLIPSYKGKKIINRNKSLSNFLINTYEDSNKSIYQLELGPKINIIDINEIIYEMNKKSKFLLSHQNSKANQNDLIKFILLDKNNINKLKFDNSILNKYVKVLFNDKQEEKEIIPSKKKHDFKDIKILDIIGNKLAKKIYIQKGRSKKTKQKKFQNKTNYSFNSFNRKNINESLTTNSDNISFLTQSDILYIQASESESEEIEESEFINNLNVEEIKNANINDILKNNLFKEKEEKIKIFKEENIYKEIQLNDENKIENENENNKQIFKSSSLNNIYSKINKIRKNKMNKLLQKINNMKEAKKFAVNIFELNPILSEERGIIKKKEENAKNNVKTNKKNNSNNKKTENKNKVDKNNLDETTNNNINFNSRNNDNQKLKKSGDGFVNVTNQMKEINEEKKKRKEEEKYLNNPKNFNLFIKSINDQYNIPNSDIKEEDNQSNSKSKRRLKRKLTDIWVESKFIDIFKNLNKVKFNDSYYIEDMNNLKNNEVIIVETKEIKLLNKTISYFPIKPIKRISLLKPNLRNAFTNLKVVNKVQFKNMIISVMKEKPIKKAKNKITITNRLAKLFLYDEEEEKKEDKEKNEKEEKNGEKDENEEKVLNEEMDKKEDKEKNEKKEKIEENKNQEKKENIINNKCFMKYEDNNLNEILKNIKNSKFKKRNYNLNYQLFYNHDRTKENEKEKEVVFQRKQFKKRRKKEEQNFNKFLNEDKDYYLKKLDVSGGDEKNDYLKEFEELKIKNKKIKIIKEFNLEQDLKMFKNELKRLKKLSDEEFLKDSLLYLNENIDLGGLKREKQRKKMNRIIEYKEFIKESKDKKIQFNNNLYKSQIIFKPSCVFNTSKIQK